MSNQISNGASRWSRRKIIQWGIGGGVGAIGTAYGLNYIGHQSRPVIKPPPMPEMSGSVAQKIEYLSTHILHQNKVTSVLVNSE